MDVPITDAVYSRWRRRRRILGTATKKCKVARGAVCSSHHPRAGINRQILGRMCEYHFLGYGMTKLERTRIMNVSLSGIPLGEWRDLTLTMS